VSKGKCPSLGNGITAECDRVRRRGEVDGLRLRTLFYIYIYIYLYVLYESAARQTDREVRCQLHSNTRQYGLL